MAKVKEVQIKLGDESRTMRFDMNAVGEFEDRTGKNLLAGIELAELSGRDLHAVVYACLASADWARDRDEPRLSYRAVGALLSPDVLPELGDALAELFGANAPPAETAEDGEADPLANTAETQQDREAPAPTS